MVLWRRLNALRRQQFHVPLLTTFNIIFCRHKTRLSLRQTYVLYCHDKILFCCDKLTFVATNTYSSRQNTSFVTTKVCIWRQTRVRRGKHLSQQKYFVAASIHLSRQRRVLSRQTRNFCHDKNDTCGSSHK